MAATKALPNGYPGTIVLFNYPESVFGKRMVRYLNLRGLPFSQIRVPPNMPRPILQDQLGIQYRRIPIMVIGRDVYIDTRLMLQKLEALFPDGHLGTENSFNSGFEDMLEDFIIDGGPFWRTSGCIPINTPLVQNDVWMKDRFDGSGGAFSLDVLKKDRAWCLSQVRLYFSLLEKMLADGREWILQDRLGLAEIHAGWVYDWAIGLAGIVDDSSQGSLTDMGKVLSHAEFPYVHAWVERFAKAADEAAKLNSGAGEIDEGSEAEEYIVNSILESGFTEREIVDVDAEDVLALRKGQRVTITPADFGFTHKDEGSLVGLSKGEAIIEVNVPNNKGTLRLHYPRINFRISPVE